MDTLANEVAPEVPVTQEPRRGLRIAMLAYAFYETDTRILQYASALAGEGHTVEVIALSRDPSLPRTEMLDGVRVHRIQSRTVNEKGLFAYGSRILRFFLRSAMFMWQRHRRRPYDLVHVHNVPDFLVFAAFYPKWKGARVILDIHDLLPEFYASKFKISHDSWLFKVLTFVERQSAALADHVIVANHLWCERFIARSSSPGKCSVVRNHPDPDIFSSALSAKKTQGKKFLLTYPGSLNWHQGLDVAIRAFARIADEMPDAEFHIYGEGPARPALMELARELEMEKRVIFHDFLPSREVARVMAETDLAIEPKRATSAFGNEALSTKILEFMALGVPVIASKTRIHAYYYDGSIVEYYENDDEKQLAEKIFLLRNSPKLREQLVANANRYVAENNWDARKHDYLSLVNSLVCVGPRIARI
jgi:glycosyltransferase involved in cell wall biosynthesis